MRRNFVLNTYNKATYLYQTQTIMQEKRVAKSFICTCNLSHVETLQRVCGPVRMRLHVSAERAWKDHTIRKFTALIFFQVVRVSCTISINGNLLTNILVCCTFCAYFCLFNLLQLVILLCCTDQKSFEGCIIANLVSNNRVSYVTPQKCDYLFVCLNIFYIFNFPFYSICGIQIITSFL